MSDRLDQLEYTMMELGAEIYRLRNEVNELNSKNESYTKAFLQIREILLEKGIAEAEEIDVSLELSQVLNQLTDGIEAETDGEVPPKENLH